MRIAVGEFAHENNTFCPGVTGIESFRARHWLAGDEILAVHSGVRNPLGGMIAASDGIELVPTLATSTEPSATIARSAYYMIRDALFAAIRDAGPLDALCLSLHGAGSAEGIDDVEGTLLTELREVVGADLPVVVTLDLHGHTTRAMLDHADALLYCHEYPHVDGFERGEEAVRLAAQIVRGKVRPVMHLETLPMMLPPSTTPAVDDNGGTGAGDQRSVLWVGGTARSARLRLCSRLPAHRRSHRRHDGARHRRR